MTTLQSCEVEVLAAFHRYEAALVRGDVDVMTELFADSPELVRFGIGDVQIGAADIAEWRSHQAPVSAGRRLFDTRVMALGADAALVTTLFDYPGDPSIGRQSQAWIRTDGGWKVTHAHVSVVAAHVP